MDLAVIIPAQSSNRYHPEGDLAPFGDTTLLEWKLAQCKEFISSDNIYVLTSSDKIQKIAKNEGVHALVKNGKTYGEFMRKAIQETSAENIMICNVTTPFIGADEYKNAYNAFVKAASKSLALVKRQYEYALFEGTKLNFHDNFTPRQQISPVDIIVNGMYLFHKMSFIETGLMIDEAPSIFELDEFRAIEIKNVLTYEISNNLITYYFLKELNV